MRSKNDFPKLESPAILSPMAGVTDVAFRTLCKRYGAGLTYTEFVSGTAIVKGYNKTLKMIETDNTEKPVAVQLFGNSIDDVVSAAKLIQDKFDIIDVNCGCPAWKVIKTGAGSEMLRSPEKIAAFISKLVDAVNKPITVKIRAGIDENSINAVEVAKLIERAGAAAIAIHGRTQQQGYSGKADWEIIKKVKENVNIPVIGNGDVFTPEDFKEKLEFSKVDFIMIARGAIGNPFIFQQINDYLKKGFYEKDNRLIHFNEYLELAEKYNIDFSDIKRHAISFTKTIQKGALLREKISLSKNLVDLKEIIDLKFQVNLDGTIANY